MSAQTKRLGPGIYARDGTIHVDLDEICRASGMEPTRENKDRAKAIVVEKMKVMFPQISVSHVDGPVPRPEPMRIEIVCPAADGGGNAAPSIRMLECVCPKSHRICAAAWQTAETTLKETASMIEATIEALGISRRCGLCGSEELFLRDSPTGFATMAEAEPSVMNLAMRDAQVRHEVASERSQRRN